MKEEEQISTSNLHILQEEVARTKRRSPFDCTKRCKYLVGIVLFLLLMFLFGLLTRSTQDVIVTPSVPATADTNTPTLGSPELQLRLQVLYDAMQSERPLIPRYTSEMTEPTILTWTPSAVGKLDAQGAVVPVTGSYVIPAGWFGLIRLVSDGEDIGSVLVDGRALSAPGTDSFIITPIHQEGEHLVQLHFDAALSCRLACSPEDALCIASLPSYCIARADNQSFKSYAPISAEAFPPPGECIEKTFIAGPQYAPQNPDDYTMCAKGKWNEPVLSSLTSWQKNGIPGVTERQQQTILKKASAAYETFFTAFIAQGQKQEERTQVDDQAFMTLSYTPGDSGGQQPCFLKMQLRINCQQ